LNNNPNNMGGNELQKSMGALVIHPLYTRAKELVRDELEGPEVENEEVRANVIAALKEEFPDHRARIEDTGMLAQEISQEISEVRRKAGFESAMDNVENSLGI
jgi:hypothetical protein